MNIQELTKTYDGKTVVDSVSFEIPKGKVLSLIGPNGAGKSTVMGMISRLIARDEGLVDFHGKDIGKWKSRELSKKLAILTQSNQIQMKLTVQELVAFGRFPYSGNRITKEDQEIIDQAIAYMELEDMRDRFIDELSGGQRQRAMIAMVIAQDTDYVLLDEPTNNLDIYQINCTYYSALGNNDAAYLLARAIQFFAPGIPQVYYVGMLAGENDLELLENTKEGRNINRHYYTAE